MRPRPDGTVSSPPGLIRWRALASGLILGFALVGWLRTPQLPLLIAEAAHTRATNPAGVRQPTLLFVFSPDDCASEYAAIDSLNRLALEGSVAVLGVLAVEQDRFDNWTDLVQAHGIRFPVVTRSPYKVRAALTQLGHPGTPALVAFDATQGLLFAAARPSDPALYALVRARLRTRPLQPRTPLTNISALGSPP